MSRFHAILLAAGAGSRFGGRKLVAPWRGEPLVRASARIALAAPVDGCFVVTGCDADVVEAALSGLDRDRLRFVRATDWAEGLAASLRKGVMAVPATSDGILVFLADMPLVPPGSGAQLIEALEGGAVGAEFHLDGAFAHPVAYSRALFADLRSLRGDIGGRRVLAGRSDVVRIGTDAPGSVFDIDSPQDLHERVRGGPS